MAIAPNVGMALSKIASKELVTAIVLTPAESLNKYLENVEPWKIVAATAGGTLVLAYLHQTSQARLPLTTRIQNFVFKWARKIPAVKNQVDEELKKVRHNFEEEFGKSVENISYSLVLPDKGCSFDRVTEEAKLHLKLGDLDWENGAMSGCMYNSSQEVSDLSVQVYGLAAWTNPLHPDAFPGLRKIEAEVVAMVCDLFHGGEEACGSVTTGGTESIILACKTYRDLARDTRGVEMGEILVPVTAHAAFDKAADLLGIRIRHVPVDEVTKRVDLRAMRRMITSKTIMLVGSAPQFPHGTMDDIQGISDLGLKYNLPVHVDACLGGFLIAFMDEAGFPLKPFDFRVAGVTSISADTHKYGYAPKGSSLVLYRSSFYRNYQYFCYPDWPGGIYGTPTITGSRAGGIIAACWAVMKLLGRDGYVSATRDIINTTRRITEAVQDVPGLKIVGVPEVSVVAFASDKFNIYGLSDGLKERGWALNALQFPSCVHLCVTRCHTKPGVAEKFISDVKEIAALLLADPGSSTAGSAAIYGMAASIPDRSVVQECTTVFLDSLYWAPRE